MRDTRIVGWNRGFNADAEERLKAQFCGDGLIAIELFGIFEVEGSRTRGLCRRQRSVIWFYNDLQVRGDCLITRKLYKMSYFVDRIVD